eukprot:1058068-Amorphochlora_amoeboformis.AAC.1
MPPPLSPGPSSSSCSEVTDLHATGGSGFRWKEGTLRPFLVEGGLRETDPGGRGRRNGGKGFICNAAGGWGRESISVAVREVYSEPQKKSKPSKPD